MSEPLAVLDKLPGPDVAGHPLGLWIGAGAVGIGLAAWVNHRRASSGTATTDDVASDGTVGGVPASGSSKGAVTLGAPGSSTAVAAATTQDDWLAQAYQALVSRGIDPITAWNGLTKFIAGTPLTELEASAVRTALAGYGGPPGGAQPIIVIPDGNVSPILTPDEAPPSTPWGGGDDPFAGYQRVLLPTTTGGQVYVPNVTGDITVEGTSYSLDDPSKVPPLNPIVVENLKPGDPGSQLPGPATVSAPSAPSSAGLTWYPQLGQWI